MESTAFKVRRVLMGVVAGLLLVSLGFYGWVQYRQSQYHQREHDVLARYQRSLALCTTAASAPALCAGRVMDACVGDPFWQQSKPFSFDATVAAPDASARCRTVISTG
jgi:hypothetical protein